VRPESTADVVLISCPNRNIDYPGLAVPTLAGALAEAGLRARALDLNVRIRHRLLEATTLDALDGVVLPELAATLHAHPVMQERALLLCRWLAVLREMGITSREIEDAKNAMCARRYSALTHLQSFQACLAVFQVSRCLNNIIDLYVACPWLFSIHGLRDPIEEEVSALLAEVRGAHPVLVGLSILDIQRPFSLLLADRLRAAIDTPIVVGGPDPTKFAPWYLAASPAIDYVLAFEAETSLSALVSARTSADRARIPNLFYRSGTSVCRTDERGQATELPAVPDYGVLPLGQYLIPALPVQASRGCTWSRCKFCVHWQTYSKLVVRPPADVASEVAGLRAKYGIRLFHFTDDALPPAPGQEIARRLAQTAPDVRWLTYGRAEPAMTPDVLRDWYKGGCRVIEWGFETAADGLLQAMEKGIVSTDAISTIRSAARVGILNKLFAFHGYPGETIEDLDHTLATLEDLLGSHDIRNFFPVTNRLELLAGSRLYQEAISAAAPYGPIRNPRGRFSIRASFRRRSSHEDAVKLKRLSDFSARVRVGREAKRIYATDDENVTLDLLVIALREDGVRPALECDARFS
jgi:anaerobic magnesium-protoporphyrin IX monomethyl ester cyclase